MASSSHQHSNGFDESVHIQPILGSLVSLEQLLSEDGETPAAISHGRGSMKPSPCEKMRRDLIHMGSVFGKIGESQVEFVGAFSSLHKKVHSVSQEISRARGDGLLTAELVRDELRSLTGSISYLKARLPSVPNPGLKDARRDQEEAGNALRFHNKLPAQYLGKKYDYGSLFAELLDGLDDLARRLLLFFAVFPAGEVISKRVLLHWWDGEGLIDLSLNEDLEAADRILKELIGRCLIEAVRKQHRLVGFKMLPFVHFAVVQRAAEAGFVAFDAMGYPTVKLSRSSRGCLVQVNTERKQIWSSLEQLKKAADADLERLQTLFNVNEQYPDFKLEFFLKLKGLKVLSLGQWQSRSCGGYHIEVESTEFLKGLGKVRGLKLLSFRGVSRVFELPDEVCYLGRLRILDLNQCHNLEALPAGIGSLKKLIHLDMSGCYLLDEMPKEIALLTELRVLKGFLIVDSADRSASCAFKDLSGFVNLIKLSINAHTADFPGKEDLDTFRKLTRLKKLSISWGGPKVFKKIRGDSGNAPIQVDNAEDNTVPHVSIVHHQNPGAAEPESNADTGITSTVDVVKRDAASGTANFTTITGAGETVKSQEIIEERETAVEGSGGDGDPLGANHGEGQHDTPEHPASMEGQAGGKHGAKKTGPTPGTTKRTAGIMLQKVFSKVPTMRDRPEADDPTRELELFKSLEKLDLQCYPCRLAPHWMKPQCIMKLKKLYLRGGLLSDFGDVQVTDPWTVGVLRLKFLGRLEMTWEKLLVLFPKVVYLEVEGCDKLSCFPSNSTGVWVDRTSKDDITSKKCMVKM